MECGFSSGSDFGFAFDDSTSSDRVLRIEIMTNLVDASSPNSDTATIADGKKKRRRENGDKAGNSYDSNWTRDCSAASVGRVQTLHINSSILATKSPFFYKLFSNGRGESEERRVTLMINAAEEAAFMELLKFMHNNTLNITAAPALLDVLMAADKFEVASCMGYCCSQLLQNFPMTHDSVLLYLELPHTVLMVDAVQPLTDAAKQYLAGRYKRIIKYKKKVMALPLSGIEAILASDDLQVASEDDVYDFVLEWARQHYHGQEERREVLGKRLARLIRFPYMTCQKLEEALACNDFTHEDASNLVLEALFFKAETQQSLTASASLNCGFVARAYKYHPIKVVEFELPQPRSVVYLDLKREECATLFPSGRVKSVFHLGGQSFYLSSLCIMNKQRTFHCFGLALGMRRSCSRSVVVDFEFAARCRPTEEFVLNYRSHYTFKSGTQYGHINLFAVPWNEFMAEDSPFFINDVLHLRGELSELTIWD